MTSALAVSATIPALPSLNLDDTERDLLARLQQRMLESSGWLRLLDAYYDGEQAMTTLGISLPPELAGLRTVLGWPRLGVDPLHERLDVEGFRYPDSDDADQAMWEIWQRNNLDEEAPLGFLDALVHGRSHLVVGADDDGAPLVTVESARNLEFLWDARRRAVKAALQIYHVDDDEFATLFLPTQTIELSRQRGGSWTIEGRDQHRVGWTPVLPMVNRARVHDRRGRSEITAELRSITDAACRAMLRMEVGAEFFSVPQRYAVGSAEQDFQDADGNMKTAWETYIGRFLLFERDSEGNAPELGQFSAGDPSVHTQVLNYYADVVASITALPPSYLGKSTDNPASADAIRMSTDRLVQRAKRKHRAFEGALEGAMRAAIAFSQGQIPDQAQLIETIWRRPEIPTPGATTDAVTKQIQAGYLPADSDVAGEELGYTPLQRRRITTDRKRAQAQQSAQALLARVQPGAAQPAAAGTQPVKPSPGAQERAQGDQQPRGATQD